MGPLATIAELRAAGFALARTTCRCGRVRAIDLVGERPAARLVDVGMAQICDACGAHGAEIAAERPGSTDGIAGIANLTRGHHEMRVAIVGSAGRLDDADRMRPELWRSMVERARGWVRAVASGASSVELVSGGSAFADHLAVRLLLDGQARGLTLHLPAAFDREARRFAGDASSPGTRLNALHQAFARATGTPSLDELAEAIGRRASVACHTHAGFDARNRAIAGDCDVLLAFTFGAASCDVRPGRRGWQDAAGAGLKSGGTARTWEAPGRARRKIHVSLATLAADVARDAAWRRP